MFTARSSSRSVTQRTHARSLPHSISSARISSARATPTARATAREFCEALPMIPGGMRWTSHAGGHRMECASPDGLCTAFADSSHGTMVIISSGDFKATIKLSSLTEARVEKELGDYCVQLMGEGGAPTLSLMLDGSVPHKDATKAWRELRAMFGESCVFDEDDAGGVMFSWSDA